MPVAQRFADGAAQRGAGEGKVGITGEVAGHRLMGVDHGMGPARLDLGEGIGAAGDDEVEAEDESGAARGEAYGGDVLRQVGDADMKSEEPTSEIKSIMSIWSAHFWWKK